MLYAILSEDVENSLEKRMSARPEHLARLQTLKDEGRLIIAGPHPAIDSEDPGPAGFSGSLVIADFPSYEDARTWADSDPFVAAGVYHNVMVKPFKQVLP
ncbi:MAG: YciI family protein [Gammaproteobacteria bacterium]